MEGLLTYTWIITEMNHPTLYSKRWLWWHDLHTAPDPRRRGYYWEFLVGVCRPVLQILSLNFRPKNVIFHTCFQTRSLKSIPIFGSGLKWVKKIAFRSGSWLREPGSTPPPRICRSIYNFNSRVLLFNDLLILFFLAYRTISTVFTQVVRSPYLYPVRSPRLIPSSCFIPSPYFPVRVLYLVRTCILYPVRSP